MEFKDKALEVVKKHGKAMAAEMIEEVVFLALEDVVKDTSNPFDDMMYNALKEPLKKAILDQINKI
jgi:hypothetical protein